MALRDLAEKDLAIVLEDDQRGFGWPVTVTDPTGANAVLKGRSNDISEVIDPDTGQLVSGRVASVTLRLSSLTAAGLAYPRNISDETSKPWLVTFDDINGNSFTFKVRQSMPDRTIGLITCYLEEYKT